MKYKNTYCFIIALFCGNIYAEMADPTKPPKKIAPKATVETQVLSLKMIKLDQNGTPTANINGEIVALGGFYADAKLIVINKDEVVLQGPKGEKITLRLYTDEHKFSSKSQAGDEVFPDIKVKNTTGNQNE